MPENPTITTNHNSRLKYERISQELDSFVHAELLRREKTIRADADESVARESRLRDKYWKDWSAADNLLLEVLALPAGALVPETLVQKIEAMRATF